MKPRAETLAVVFLLLSCIFTGCRQAERIAWAADARGAIGLPVPGGEPPRQQSGLADYLAGLLAENKGAMKAAISYYRSASQRDPSSAQILLRLGIVHLQNNEPAEAIRILERACKTDPSDPKPRFVLGVLYTDQGRFEEASDQYAQVLNQDTKNLGALSQLADLYLLQEKLQEALAVYERLLQERPDSAVAHFNIGVLYAKVEEWTESVEHLARAVEIDPSFLEARLGLAVSLELAGQLQQAKEQFLAALQQEPVNTQLIHYLAQISYRLGDLKESARWLTRYLSYEPRDPDAHMELAYVQIDQGRWQEAAEQIQMILDPRSPAEGQADLWMALGQAYQSGRKYAAAEEAYRQAAQMSPEDLRPTLQMAGLFQRTGRFEEAERILQEAFSQHPDDPNLLNSLGYLYADQGIHLEEAVSLLERAMRQDPTNGAYMDSLGWVYFKLNHPEDALNLLEQAAVRLPDQEVFEHLGEVYLKLGKEQEALSVWKKGMGLETKDPEITDRLDSLIRTHSGKRKER